MEEVAAEVLQGTGAWSMGGELGSLDGMISGGRRTNKAVDATFALVVLARCSGEAAVIGERDLGAR